MRIWRIISYTWLLLVAAPIVGVAANWPQICSSQSVPSELCGIGFFGLLADYPWLEGVIFAIAMAVWAILIERDLAERATSLQSEQKLWLARMRADLHVPVENLSQALDEERQKVKALREAIDEARSTFESDLRALQSSSSSELAQMAEGLYGKLSTVEMINDGRHKHLIDRIKSITPRMSSNEKPGQTRDPRT